MPNRIIRESACTSATLAQLTSDEERCFWRLVVLADDFGIYYARPSVVRAKGFSAMVDSMSDKDVGKWLNALERVDLIRRYTAAGDLYLQIVTWSKHQRRRTVRSKYPLPPADLLSSARRPDSNPDSISDSRPAATCDGSVRVSEESRSRGSRGVEDGESAVRSDGTPDSNRGHRVPEGALPEDWRAFAVSLRLDADAVYVEFVDYWRGVPGARGRKSDWPATWRNRCRELANGRAGTSRTNGLTPEEQATIDEVFHAGEKP